MGVAGAANPAPGWATVAADATDIGVVAAIGVAAGIGVVAGIVVPADAGVATGIVAAIGGEAGIGVRAPLGRAKVGEASQKPAGRSVLPPVAPPIGVRGTVGATAEDDGTVLKALTKASAV
jgi:hypothetical protein